jgi:predicted Zn-dependent peptidase
MSVQLTQLDNGLRVVTHSMAHVETVSLGIWVGAGSRYEQAAENGAAHLLEHMVFKGTKHRTAQAIAEEIEAVGGHLNAYTARESTAYYAKVLKQDADLALDIVSDLLQHAVLDEGELARERDVVLQEIGQSWDTPDDIIFDQFQAIAFPDQPAGRPVLGSHDSVRNMSRGALSGYLAGHYGGPTMVLSAAGNLSHDWLVDRAAAVLTDLPTGVKTDAAPARYVGGEYREARDLEQLHLILGFPAFGLHDPDFYTLQVLATLFGGGMSSRLFQEVRERRGLVYSIYNFASILTDDGLFGIYAGTSGQCAPELVAVLADEIGRLADSLTEEEIARARAQLKASLLMGLESTSGRCEQLGTQVLVFGGPLTTEELVAKIDAVDRADVARVARRLFTGTPTLAALGQVNDLEAYDRIAARLG